MLLIYLLELYLIFFLVFISFITMFVFLFFQSRCKDGRTFTIEQKKEEIESNVKKYLLYSVIGFTIILLIFYVYRHSENKNPNSK